jgi:hydroxymethylglutaryl-CoA reductase (NADPH)
MPSTVSEPKICNDPTSLTGEPASVPTVPTFSGSIQDGVHLPGERNWSEAARQERLSFLEQKTGISLSHLAGKEPDPESPDLKGNIEQFLGMTRIPTGVIGPLQVQGKWAKGDYYVPLATTEGALVASYNRGAKATRLSGGITALCLAEGVQRAPVFRFDNLMEVSAFLGWALAQEEAYRQIVGQNSRYARLQGLKASVEGNSVILQFEFTTGEAAGQNMVTICTNAICQFILETSPVKPVFWLVEGNFSGDKKATSHSLAGVRGKRVTAEALVTSRVLEKLLRTNAADMERCWQLSAIGCIQSGSIGIQAHYANGLAALFLATGQDVACVAEAFPGITRMEARPNGDLYISVTLPNLMVGTVGGGTWLPGQRECLQLLGCTGPDSARRLAEICGATVLAGELSIAAAMASHDFSQAHKTLGRRG